MTLTHIKILITYDISICKEIITYDINLYKDINYI